MVGCGSYRDAEHIQSSLLELERLANTAGVEVLDHVIQYRKTPDPAWLIGRGKVENLADQVYKEKADMVIVDRELLPGQQINLKRMLSCKVLDRTQLILDIFAMRARTREGRVQVELAQLEYLLPRLTGMGHHLSRLGGGIGTRGPGEKKLETDRRHIRRRIQYLKKDLERIRKHRDLHQSRRRKMDMTQVALVGYTNAGKSTLLNRLTGAGVPAEDRLFATLDPTSRFLVLPSEEKVILTDTVGFIRRLPHHLVASFRSTLEQVREADLLLHVVDASHPEATEQMDAAEEVLKELHSDRIPVLTVFNKIDSGCDRILTAEGESIRISALDDGDLIRLKEKMDSMLHAVNVQGSAEIPVSKGEIISCLYKEADVFQSKVVGLTMKMDFQLPLRRYERLSQEVKAFICNIY
ncbi:GTP-binding protein HflX [Melghirimyces algeriensis]|uniref:GTPase HflX n=1 Tax=Melghirimyces algeriensis TaxID=910412 RepID=A0A521CA92_9BACL|nr:GTP-binding protein HflX [Melghirimyces algeriensis]